MRGSWFLQGSDVVKGALGASTISMIARCHPKVALVLEFLAHIYASTSCKARAPIDCFIKSRLHSVQVSGS